MRIVLALFILVAGLAGATAEPEDDFRSFLDYLFRAYGKTSNLKTPMEFYCEEAKETQAKFYPRSEAWQGMVMECLGYAELFDEEGTRLAACEYFIRAANHYKKARPTPRERAALRDSAADVKQKIGELGC